MTHHQTAVSASNKKFALKPILLAGLVAGVLDGLAAEISFDNAAMMQHGSGVLNKLSGVRYLRYRKGVWAAREGLVYDGFDRALHVIRRDQVPELKTRFRAIDFGFSNAFVCQFWGLDYDGRMYLYREIYHTQRTVAVHAKQIKALSAGETFTATVCDHDAEDRATLQEQGISNLPAQKAIRPGIDAVMERLKLQGDGKPRLYIVEDALVERDHSLRDNGLPTCTLEEFGSYAWPESKPDRNGKEVPVDAYNHGMDALRYAVMHVDTKGSAAVVQSPVRHRGGRSVIRKSTRRAA